ncbi:conserved exported protein of unknown function [Nitrospira defluvii]|jgi:hypothetical protein|uniref:Ice-binding protein C-terminal domain-containing protein n=1 Tax=Nitrospira defluvii TaxID=330214 RepID=D8PEL4_9BACT|nr:conserved exported protein of unknown function [Nitrospira defluvii]
MGRIRLAFVACVFCLASTASVGAVTFPFELDIVSGANWRSATNPGLVGPVNFDSSGSWTTVGFNDNAWVPAVPVPNNVITPQTVVPGTAAQFMWSPQGMQGIPTGSNGSADAYFRYKFALPQTAELPLTAIAKITADDRFDIFVNGDFLKASTLEFNRDGIRPLPKTIDFVDKLVFGENVIAIRGRDGSPGSNRDPGDPFSAGFRVNQFVFFDGYVSSAPEPGTILVLGSGMLGLIGWRWKQVKSPRSAGF